MQIVIRFVIRPYGYEELRKYRDIHVTFALLRLVVHCIILPVSRAFYGIFNLYSR